MHIVGAHGLERIDVAGAPLEARDGGGQQPGRDALTARDQGVLQPGIGMAKHCDGGTQVFVLARHRVDVTGQGAELRSWSQHCARGLPVLALESQCGLRSALQQQVGHAGERRRDHDQRTAVGGDLPGRFLNGAAIG